MAQVSNVATLGRVLAFSALISVPAAAIAQEKQAEHPMEGEIVAIDHETGVVIVATDPVPAHGAFSGRVRANLGNYIHCKHGPTVLDNGGKEDGPMTNLSAPYLHDEEAAYEFLEDALWPDGPVCPHCGCMGRITKVRANPEKRIRHGLHRCGDCKKQFTVKIGTVFEDSKVKLHLWLQAVVLMTSSKKGFSAHQLHRTLGVTYKTAWFMAHRIREAMRSGELAPMGSDGGVVEVDETFIGRDPARKKAKNDRGGHHKNKVLSLVDRTSGQARSVIVDDLKASTIVPILRANIAKEATIYTDEAGQYNGLLVDFAEHDFVRHARGEFSSATRVANTVAASSTRIRSKAISRSSSAA